MYLTRRTKIIAAVAAAVILILFISGTIYIKNAGRETQILAEQSIEPAQPPKPNTEADDKEKTANKEEAPDNAPIIVYVCGAVKKPGNVKLQKDMRIADALREAGGSLSEADLTRINLASKLSDGEMVYVPKKGEQTVGASPQNAAPTASAAGSSSGGKININTAAPADLDKLPGIGAATAQKIIDYRNTKGKFKNIKELTAIPGIGEAKFEKLKDQVTVQ